MHYDFSGKSRYRGKCEMTILTFEVFMAYNAVRPISNPPDIFVRATALWNKTERTSINPLKNVVRHAKSE